MVGLHFEAPLYYSYNRHKELRYLHRTEKSYDDSDVCSTTVCGKCKYCSALLSKFQIFSAPIRKQYVFAKTNYLKSSEPKIVEIDDSNDEKNQATSSNCSSETLSIEKPTEKPLDPIEDICDELRSASIDYIDQLNNILGISLIETDPRQAMRCWASTKDNPKALFNMGVAYERGLHSAKGLSDLKQAFHYYALSARLGHKLAIYNLALFYLSGKGEVPVDYSRAESLLRRAAEMGVEPAQNYIDKLEERRMSSKKKTTQITRNSASAPNLMVWTNCSDSLSTRSHESFNRIPQTFKIANRVWIDLFWLEFCSNI